MKKRMQCDSCGDTQEYETEPMHNKESLSVNAQAELLIEKVVRKYKRESVENGGSKTVNGTVMIQVDGVDCEYDYEAEVSLRVEHWREKHPYGMGTASEEQAEVHVEDVSILKIVALNGAPEDGGSELSKLKSAIIEDAEERAKEL